MDSLKEDIRKFLELRNTGSGDGFGYGDGSGSGSGDGYGYGSGSGDGFGYGDGSGDGSGYGYGFGYGDGSGDGSGSGDGYGSGSGDGDWKSINGRDIHYIDDVPTVIESVHGDHATGYIVSVDLTARPCYIARFNNSWAHGDTLHQAVADAMAKDLEDRPLEDRLAAFVAAHPDLDTPYGDLFEWHHTLTGSCRAGREEWCRAHGYKPTDSITVRSFIEQTRFDYGHEAIDKLYELYKTR